MGVYSVGMYEKLWRKKKGKGALDKLIDHI